MVEFLEHVPAFSLKQYLVYIHLSFADQISKDNHYEISFGIVSKFYMSIDPGPLERHVSFPPSLSILSILILKSPSIILFLFPSHLFSI